MPDEASVQIGMVNPIVLGEYIEAGHRVVALGATESFLLASLHHDSVQ